VGGCAGRKGREQGRRRKLHSRKRGGVYLKREKRGTGQSSASRNVGGGQRKKESDEEKGRAELRELGTAVKCNEYSEEVT